MLLPSRTSLEIFVKTDFDASECKILSQKDLSWFGVSICVDQKLTFIVRCFLIFLLAEKARELTLFYLTEKFIETPKNNKS